MKRFTLLTLSIVICGILSSTNYYASSNGTGNGKSLSSPTSFTDGLSKLSSPGDTLYLLNGQYNLGNTQINSLNGSATKRIVISGYNGINAQGSYDAILDFRTVPYGTRGLQVKSTCSYVHIKNLTLRYSGKNNLYNEGSYCLFENLDIYGSGDTGCQMKNGGNNTIKNVDSHDNFDYETMSGTTANFGGNADGFADKQHNGGPNHYIGCRAWNNSDDGWDFYQRVSSGDNTIIENCVCYMNGCPYYDMSNNPRALGVDKSWFDSKVGTQMTDRYGNTITITLTKYPCQGNGNGFKMGGGYTDAGGTQHNILIHHCYAVGNYARGFDQNNCGGNMYIYNNTAYLNQVNYGFTTSFGTNYLRNNISWKGTASDGYPSKSNPVNDHNTWNSGFSVYNGDFLSRDTTLILAPRQADGSLPENNFLHLADGSELIDAGVDIGFPYTGEAPDLGCFETDGVVHPQIVCTSDNLEQWIQQGEEISSIIIQWGGSATSLSYTLLPDGLTAQFNSNNTLIISGNPSNEGTFTFTVTTISEESDNPSLTATIHIKSASAKRVAFVTSPGAAADATLLQYLNTNDIFVITQTDAADNTVNYTGYDVLVLGSVPPSSASGFSDLKGYDKPMLVLKPFLFKNTVWNWGNSDNTSDLSTIITQPSHVIFTGLTPDANNELQLFSSVNTNAVTGIASWYNTTGFDILATSISNGAKSNTPLTTIADFPAGTDCNGTILSERLVMIGVSEYSTANLTADGLKLIENAILYLLNMTPTAIESIDSENQAFDKILQDGRIILIRNNKQYSILGTNIK